MARRWRKKKQVGEPALVPDADKAKLLMDSTSQEHHRQTSSGSPQKQRKCRQRRPKKTTSTEANDAPSSQESPVPAETRQASSKRSVLESKQELSSARPRRGTQQQKRKHPTHKKKLHAHLPASVQSPAAVLNQTRHPEISSAKTGPHSASALTLTRSLGAAASSRRGVLTGTHLTHPRPSLEKGFEMGRAAPLDRQGSTTASWHTQSRLGNPERVTVTVDYNQNKRGIVQYATIEGAVHFRSRRNLHPRVGLSRNEYLENFEAFVGQVPVHSVQGDFSRRQPEAVRLFERRIKDEWKDTNPRKFHSLWPYSGSKTTSIATMRTGAKWDRPEAHQTSKLFLTMKLIPALGHALAKEGHYALASLSQTCQLAFSMLANQYDLWDMTQGQMNGANLGNGVSNVPNKLSNDRGSASKVVRVTSVRYFLEDYRHLTPRVRSTLQPTVEEEMAHAMHTERDLEVQFLKTIPEGHVSERTWVTQFDSRAAARIFKPSYMSRTKNIFRLFQAIYNMGELMSVLHLHRVSLLDLKGIRVILDASPKLTMLGVYSCELVHFGHVVPLLDIIRNFNLKNDRKGPERLDLDFSPRYHAGPLVNGRASYGVTWNNHHGKPIQQGIFQVATCAVLKAEAMGIDLTSPGRAFRAYLDKLPLHKFSVPHWIDTLFWWLEVADWPRPSTKSPLEKNVITSEELDQLQKDFVAVVIRGLDSLPPTSPLRMPAMIADFSQYQRWRYCEGCDVTQRAVFFGRNQKLCAGCILRHVLDSETNHLKRYKRLLVDSFFSSPVEPDCRRSDLERAPLLAHNPIMDLGVKLRHISQSAANAPHPSTTPPFFNFLGPCNSPEEMFYGLKGNEARLSSAINTVARGLDFTQRVLTMNTGIMPDSWEEEQMLIAADYTSRTIRSVHVDPDIGPFPGENAPPGDVREYSCNFCSYGRHAQLSLQAIARKHRLIQGERFERPWYWV